MKITFLGTGTSQGVPVIACECEVCQSEDSRDKRLRTSVLLQTSNTAVVIDSGPDFRAQMLREKVKRLDAVVFTHEHKDHVAGLDDVRAFNYAQDSAMNVFAHTRVQEALKREFSYVFSDSPYPGLPRIHLSSIEANESFSVGEMDFLPLEVFHYKLPILGFRVGDFAYITDAKTILPKVKEQMKGLKVLVLNALQKDSHFSHFTLSEALELIEELKPERSYLTHISHKMGTHTDTETLLPSNVFVAYDGLSLDV